MPLPVSSTADATCRAESPWGIAIPTNFTHQPDHDGIFAAARRDPLHTSWNHYALTWPEAPWLPESWREAVASATRLALSKRITLPGGFSFALPFRLVPLERMQRARWLTLPLPAPVEWLRLVEHFNEPNAIRVKVAASRKQQLGFELLLSRGGQPLAYAHRRIDLAARHVKHSFFAVARNNKTAGVGAQVIANAVCFYRELRIASVGLKAGLTAGGAVWPLFGFRPVDEAEWAKVRTTIRTNYARLPSVSRRAYPGGPAALDAAVIGILADPEPDAIWTVADLDPGGAVARAGNLPHSLGGWLLQGSRWKGILELDNPAAESRLRQYLQLKIARGTILAPQRW